MAWGKKLGQNLKLGQLIEFVGDLGGGKTTIIKGIAQGLGIEKTVTSPTFNVMRSYELKSGGSLGHYDLYRIGDDDVVARELRELVEAGQSIVVVEWSRPFVESIKSDYLRIGIEVKPDDERIVTLTAHGPQSFRVLEAIR
ncbi:tRNA (adenosine(37)-N6)-threonylcarbamoyltransferase complex ATPase subunit type 1 TsaE [bacterium]|nr:tRNA (adenosine(37)-N6)-threonylcarbamoyltransferase complex ATPase subunit type 1 TsaE [bacterium]